MPTTENLEDSVKTIEEWEKELGFIVIDDTDISKKITGKEAGELFMSPSAKGVDHEQRIAFLKENGYEVNRENLADHELSSTKGEQPDER